MPPLPTFTLAEASAQLPALRARLATVMELRLRLKIIYQRLDNQGVPPGETLPWGAPAQAITDHAVFAGMSEALRDEVDAVRALGVVVRDIEVGLIDWRARLPEDAAPLWWSWRYGERAIEHFRWEADPADRRSLGELPATLLVAAAGRAPTRPRSPEVLTATHADDEPGPA